jgi:beta-xylosidase
MAGLLLPAAAQHSRPSGSTAHTVQEEEVRPAPGAWGDQGDGTYVNPVMPGDFSDLDAIRVGRMYYAISSTMQFSPGMAVLASHDLVNWTIAGHVVDDLTQISPELNWDRMNRRGRGIWAGSIRYHRGRYWVVFGTPDEGLFLSSAKQAAGPWEQVALLLPQPGWDDPCIFWDRRGQGYLVATRFAADANRITYNIHLWKMSPDNRQLLVDSDRIIHHSKGSEANKLYQIHGYYYHYYSEVRAEGRVAMMGRARRLGGPWQARQLIHVRPAVDKEPNQGGLVELPSGKWYFVSHQGTGDWEGRAGVLLPVKWIDGWPILGRPGPDGVGNMVWRGDKPVPGFARTSLAAIDDFSTPALRPEWEWNYQPRAGSWSLSERPGFLRLHAFSPLHAGDFLSTGNVLTQRSMRTRQSRVTVRMELAGMIDGQEAGLAHFSSSFATISITQQGSERILGVNINGERQAAVTLAQPTAWFRSTWNQDGISQFSYSLDGLSFVDLGQRYQLAWGDYRGDRIGLFTVLPHGQGGYVDVDTFNYTLAR